MTSQEQPAPAPPDQERIPADQKQIAADQERISPERRTDRPRWRRRVALPAVGLAAATVLAAGVAVAAAVGFGSGRTDTATASTLPPATATVARQTLTDSKAVSGELGYGPSRTIVARAAGTLTALTPVGTTVSQGQALYAVDNEKIVLLYGNLPAYRTLEPGLTGADVKQFEQNLSKLGYAGFTVDDEYTWATAEVVRKWQADLGLPKTGRVEPEQISYAPGKVRVDSHRAEIGDLLQSGGPVLTTTGTDRLVTVELDITDLRLAEVDSEVAVALPDRTTVPGTIIASELVISGGDGQQEDPETIVEVTVAVDDPAAIEEYDRASVEVSFTTDRREDVLTVPVAALLALAEGGYGVEVVDGPDTRIVAVQTGLFAGGQVEISGDGLTAGLTVGVPS